MANHEPTAVGEGARPIKRSPLILHFALASITFSASENRAKGSAALILKALDTRQQRSDMRQEPRAQAPGLVKGLAQRKFLF
jgi:hypothetical protein